MMRNRRHRIHWQMTFYVGCVVFGLFVLFAVVDYIQQEKHLIESRAAYMAQELQLLAAAIQRETAPQKRNQFIQDYCAKMRFHGRPGHGLAVIKPSGEFYSTGEILGKDAVTQTREVQQVMVGTGSRSVQWTDRFGRVRVLVAAHAYSLPGDTRRGVVYYSESLKDIETLSRKLILERAAMLLLLFVAIALVIGMFVKYKIAAPLDALLLHEWAAGTGNLSRRTYPDPRNEISGVCEMFNYMLTKIEEREDDALAEQPEGEPTEPERGQGEHPDAGEQDPGTEIHLDTLGEDSP